MKKEFKLSEKRKDSYRVEDLKEGLYRGIDVKEFIKKLKEGLLKIDGWKNEQVELIDKLAGDLKWH